MNKFFDFKEGLSSLVKLSEKGDINWEDFSLKILNFLKFSKSKENSLNINTLEKIRFFLSFMNINSYFDFENIPKIFENIKYQPKYSSWMKNNSYSKNYKRHLKNDSNFFKNHINLSVFPNYPVWNLSMRYLDLETICNHKEKKLEQYFPLQIFENKEDKIIGIIALAPKSSDLGEDINSFSFIYNFNIFTNINKHNKSIYPKNLSIFESYVTFIDEINNNCQNPYFSKNNYKVKIDFKLKNKNTNYEHDILNKKTVRDYNLLYYRNMSNFIKHFLSDTNFNNNGIRNLFKTNFSILDFNKNKNFLLIIKKKKKNISFNNLLLFFQNWAFHTVVYELKDRYMIFGYLFSNFFENFSEEQIFIAEIFEQMNIDYTFLLSNIDYKVSNLSVYNLPSSDQFNEEYFSWDLNLAKFPLSIADKEEFIISQINKEKSFFLKI